MPPQFFAVRGPGKWSQMEHPRRSRCEEFCEQHFSVLSRPRWPSFSIRDEAYTGCRGWRSWSRVLSFGGRSWQMSAAA